MPENRPGRAIHVTNSTGGTLTHGQPVVIDNYVGVAVKQKAVNWDKGLADQEVIQEDEEFLIMTKGLVLVEAIASPDKGDPVYIIAAENKLTGTKEGNVAFGRIYNEPGERGVPTGYMRVDLDAKDSL